MPPESDLRTLLRTMDPVLNPGTYAFATVPASAVVGVDDVVASIREAEGLSVIVEALRAEALGLTPAFLCSWITLTVNSDLEAVGLTAAFAGALGRAGISCNVVAGTCHDHIFVPVADATRAVAALRALQHLGVRS